MDNPEYIFQLLETFSKLRRKDIIPQDLEEYITYVARTGDPVFQWSLVKVLLKEKLVAVLNDFHKDSPSLDIPECANVEPFRYDIMKVELLSKFDSFSSAPFTVQRICELLSTPRKEYKRIDKYMRAIEKNILVVSTRDSMIKRCLEAEISNESIINGVGSDKDDDNVEILHDDKNLNSDEKMIVTEDEGEVFTIDSRFEEWNEDNDEQEILDPSITESDMAFDKIENKESNEVATYSLMQFGSLHESNVKLDIQLPGTSESNRKKLSTCDDLQKPDHFLLSERLTSKVSDGAENAYHKILETFQLSGKACEDAVHVGHEMTTSEIEQILSEEIISPTYSPTDELENENDDFDTEFNSPLHVVNNPGLEITDIHSGEKDSNYQEVIVLPELAEEGKTSEVTEESSTNIFKSVMEASPDKVTKKEAENSNEITIEEMMEEVVEANDEINVVECEKNKKLEIEKIVESEKTAIETAVEKEEQDGNTEDEKFKNLVGQLDKPEADPNLPEEKFKNSKVEEIDTNTKVDIFSEIQVTNQEIFSFHEDPPIDVIENIPKVDDEVKGRNDIIEKNVLISDDINNLPQDENQETKEAIPVPETITNEVKDEQIKEEELQTVTEIVEPKEKKLEESDECTETNME